MNDKKTQPYYLGLDIGTDSCGYAATDRYYLPVKAKGEPVMGVTTFEAANQAADRRSFRTARRRIDRVQQRVALANEVFVPLIAKKDPTYFIRREGSYLYRDEAGAPYPLFNDPDFTDKEYYAKYPTIHHLICDLMTATEPRDVRLVHLACTWLIAHRGHFLFDISADDTAKLLDFNVCYADLRDYFINEVGCSLPWSDTVTPDALCSVLTMNAGVKRKKEKLLEIVWGMKKLPKKTSDDYPFSKDAIADLLAGKKTAPKDLYGSEDYAEVESVALNADDETFARIVSALGDAGELLVKLRALQDCAMLIVAQAGKATISEAKVAVYEQHKKDLAGLKRFVRKYMTKEDYREIFRYRKKQDKEEKTKDENDDKQKKCVVSYTAYSYNVKNCKGELPKSKATKTAFCESLKKQLKDIIVEPADKAFYDDMMARLETCTFLPKQKDSDNRVIPQQLYRYELKQILDHAVCYLPALNKKDATGLTAAEKLLSIFDFRIPYFVGPLRADGNPHAWLERKEGKIYPWNFAEMVDLDKSEAAFISRMTNTCTYLAGEEVLPAKSLTYCKFVMLNELNPLKVDDKPIPVEVKQKLFNAMLQDAKLGLRPTRKKLEAWLIGEGLMKKTQTLSGVDEKLNATLAPYHSFRSLMSSGILTEQQVEEIIRHAAYSEDKNRLRHWLEKEYPQISEGDRKYIVKLNLKEFGRLSAEFLTGLMGANRDTGEAYTIMEALWNTNRNLMQLLSGDFDFRDRIAERNKEYYSAHPATLDQRLDEMYVSNAVKRPILRTLAICDDVVKAMGHAPEKIFVEMARDPSGEQKGQRTKSRKEQVLELLKKVKADDAQRLKKELDAMGAMTDNRLQSDKLFLYYLQLGKCAYSGQPIELSSLFAKDLHNKDLYNIDHIYPQALVKDDSLLNNKVLVLSTINAEKGDSYPVPAKIRNSMSEIWKCWAKTGLMTEEKLRRLTRSTPFTDAEKMGFINRQLVETRQSTKAVAQLLQEKYPETEIVYVKAGLVSEYRQQYQLLKSRSVNCLHHAKDAYLNIVVGNVYHCRFSKQWFRLTDKYSMRTENIFNYPVKCGNETVWQGKTDVKKVETVMAKNHIHVTRFAFCRKGGLFDQQPVKAAPGLVPLKAKRDTAKYGGYNKPTAAFFYLVKYSDGKKTDVMFMPVALLFAEQCKKSRAFADEYAARTIGEIFGKEITDAKILLDYRPIKVNSILSLDGLRVAVNGKANGGKILVVSLNTQLLVEAELEKYVKTLESNQNKLAKNKSLVPDEAHDHISSERNITLYDALLKKLSEAPFAQCPGNQYDVLSSGREKFVQLTVSEQVSLLINVLAWFNNSGSFDFSLVGGKSHAGAKYPSSSLSNWASKYKTVQIIDQSPSGIYETRSGNLLELL